MVIIDHDVLAFDTGGECVIHNGPALALETARRLSCDASAVLVTRGRNGGVLDIGRTTRTIPRAIKRALRIRDKTCRWPGCDEFRYLDGHHLRHWSHLGATKLTNLVHLCWHHHFLVHEGGWSLELLRDGTLHIEDAFGRPLGGPASPSIAGEPSIDTQNRRRGTTIDETTSIPRCYGDSLDLGQTISDLLWLRDPGFASQELVAACRPAEAEAP